MKLRAKTLIAAGIILLTNLGAPFLVVHLAPAEWGMGLCIIMWFAVVPAVDFFLGIFVGKEMKKLWWIPLAAAVSTPLLFNIVVWDFIPELFWYALPYFGIGAVSMLITHFWGRYLEKHKK